MHEDRWRLFVAVPVGDELRTELAAVVDGWKTRPALAGLRWTTPENWHVTLAFLGDVDQRGVTDVASKVSKVVGRHSTICLLPGSLGGFPSVGRARVAWYGLLDEGRRLQRLAHDLRAEFEVDTARPFTPHITLARAKGQPVNLIGWTTDAANLQSVLEVQRLALMRSHLGGGPARYEELRGFALSQANAL